MYRSIVVPLDGSDFGEKALPYAVMIARDSGATLHLVHVHNDRYNRETAYLANLAGRIASEHGLPSTSVLAEGSVVGETRRSVAKCSADLVVMSTHARGPLSRLWFGSVAQALIHSVKVPVLLINPDAPTPAGLLEKGFRRILVALDGSELAEEVLGHAAALAATRGARLILVSSVETFGTHHIAASGNPPTSRLARENSPNLDAYYEGLSKQLRAMRVPFEVKLVEFEHPAEAIVSSADEYDADVIAVATHGRSGLSRFLFGSIAEAVLRMIDKPVLVFHPAGVGETLTTNPPLPYSAREPFIAL